jgi:hypothetical protein
MDISKLIDYCVSSGVGGARWTNLKNVENDLWLFWVHCTDFGMENRRIKSCIDYRTDDPMRDGMTVIERLARRRRLYRDFYEDCGGDLLGNLSDIVSNFKALDFLHYCEVEFGADVDDCRAYIKLVQ